MSVVAVDQGTTSTKVGILSDDGGFHTVFQRGHRQIHPQEGWVEHDPLELLENVRAGIHAAEGDAGLDAVGIANQGETVLAWEAGSCRPICPAIVWQDRRTTAEVEAMRAGGAEAVTLDRAGLPLDPYFSASKFGWIMANVPEAAELHAAGRLRLGTTDAFFLECLSGEFATDVTTASRTSLLNLRELQWDLELCELFGVPMDALPEIRPSAGWFGDLGVGGRSIPVTASVVDQQAALYGHGCRAPGDGKVTFGTGAFVLAVAGSALPGTLEAGLLPTVAWQRDGEAAVYAVDGGVYDAGSALSWARQLGLFERYDDLDVAGPPAIDRGLVFVPALSGLACPHWDRRAAAGWIGMTQATSPLDLARAVMEGVALLTAEVIAVVDRTVAPSGPLSVDGGLARSAVFCEFLATVVGRPVRVPQNVELTMLGAAQLAAGKSAPAEPAAGTLYDPRGADAARWAERFGAAVSRVRAWHT
jgi:glycerol kinase